MSSSTSVPKSTMLYHLQFQTICNSPCYVAEVIPAASSTKPIEGADIQFQVLYIGHGSSLQMEARGLVKYSDKEVHQIHVYDESQIIIDGCSLKSMARTINKMQIFQRIIQNELNATCTIDFSKTPTEICLTNMRAM